MSPCAALQLERSENSETTPSGDTVGRGIEITYKGRDERLNFAREICSFDTLDHSLYGMIRNPFLPRGQGVRIIYLNNNFGQKVHGPVPNHIIWSMEGKKNNIPKSITPKKYIISESITPFKV